VHQYQGAEFAYVAFDELTHFTEAQYTYLLSRARSASSIPIRVRAATNPGGIGAEWVMRRWGPWLDPTSPERATPGAARHYVNTSDGERWVAPGTPGALSRVFVAARIADNPHLARNDPGYAQRLMGLDPVTRAQLLEGNWLIQPARGLYFRRAWLAVADAPPAAATRVRYWDRAASVDGDYTAGVRLARTADDLYWVEDVVRLRGTPREVEAAIHTTAELDGTAVTVGIEQDPGQAGRFEAEYYIRALAGWNVRACPATGDKLTRAQPVSAQCEAGNVRLVRGAWNAALVQELEAFPEGRHDDQVDALSGAFALLTRATHRPYRSAPAAPSRWS
jgi:predicted phage terminase large subunit-like protein